MRTTAIIRNAILGGLFSCSIVTVLANAQPGNRPLNLNYRALDLLFPIDVESKPYVLKVVARFSSDGYQIIAVEYPNGKSEIIQSSLGSVADSEFNELMAKLRRGDPDAEVTAFAAKLRSEVHTERSEVSYMALNRKLKRLRAIRIPGALDDKTCVDEGCDEYELWYDTWQEVAHYTLVSPARSSPFRPLVDWMIELRSSMPQLMNSHGRAGGPGIGSQQQP